MQQIGREVLAAANCLDWLVPRSGGWMAAPALGKVAMALGEPGLSLGDCTHDFDDDNRWFACAVGYQPDERLLRSTR